MNKIVTAIASAAFLMLATTGKAAAQSFPPMGDGDNTDSQLIYNGDPLDSEQTQLVEMLSGVLSITPQQLLDDPQQMDSLFVDGTDPQSNDGWLGTFQKNGCYVNADCAFKAIGLGLVIQCSPSGTDPEAWAKCVKTKDENKYYAAIDCTYGSCPSFGSIPGQPLFACGKDSRGVMADNRLLSLPPSLNRDHSESLSLDLLSRV